MKTTAQTVEEYLAKIPTDRREALTEVRRVILENLPAGFVEVINWGMITYEVPLAVFPDTYNKKPLMYAALGNQKNHMAVYLCGVYGSEKVKTEFLEIYEKSGKKLDMGASCVRFKKLDTLCLEAVAYAVGAFAMKDFVEYSIECHRKK